MATDWIHPFEKAGLGQAPFKVLGCSEERGPKRMPGPGGVTFEVGSPGQPMGTCKYCGQGIAYCYLIESACGKRFTVGSDCVAKAYDSGLTAQVTEIQRSIKRAQRDRKRASEEHRIAAAYGLLDATPNLQQEMGVQPPPSGKVYRPNRDNSELAYVNFCRRNAGHTGKLRCAKMIERAAMRLGILGELGREEDQ